ncbi:MAG: PAS domain S-box protein [Limimaricola soesokkakensis]|uniref:PAS domain S-box protein n=1 Tax=Limimaricola soesokkakensis TaxID=1343159 RepID=UPI0040587828
MRTIDFLQGLGVGGSDRVDWPAVFDRLHEGLVIAEVVRDAKGGVNWRYLHVNEAWSRLTGLSAEGIAGRLVTDVIPGVEQHWVEDFAAVALKQEPRNFVGPVSELGRVYDIRAFPISSARFGLLFLDVTERERQEAELKERAEALEAQIRAEFGMRARIWDVSPEIQVVANHAGYFEQVNLAATAILGHSKEVLLSTPFMELIHPEDRAGTLAAFENVKQDQPVLRFDNRYRHADGGYRWLSWVTVPHEGRIYATARDITQERAHAEELELRRAERSNLWSASRDLHLICSLDGIYQEVSDAWQSQLGFAPDELVGMRFDALIHEDDLDFAHRLFAELLETGSVGHAELRLRDRAGEIRWFGWSAVISGGVIFATGRDLGEKRRQEEQLRLAEEALAQSRKLETLGQLTGGVAHDFNNLLAAIQTNLSLLRRQIEAPDDRALTLLDRAQASADRGAKLVQHMLAFARRQDLTPRPVNACALLAEMEPLLRSSIGPGIEILRRFDEDAPPALVDANQLEMAVLNLVVNARDAMEGRGALTLACRLVKVADEPDLAPGSYVVIEVEDNGPGMDAAVLAQATEPFFTTKGVGKGTGLGLSMVHGLARQSGGAFRLDSAPGRGTTARIFLPVAATADKAAPEPPDTTRAAGPERPLKILVVDDDFLVLMGTIDMLEALGHEVLEAANGEAALDQLRAHPDIDLLITDQAMPGMTGAQLAEASRALRPELPVLLCTGYGELPPGSESVIAGRLGKPFTEAQLGEAISGVVCATD